MKFLVLLSLLLVINVQAIAMDDVDEVFFFESIPEDMQSNPRQLVGGYYNNLAATVKTVYSTLTLCNNLVSSSCAIYGAALVAAFQAINVSSTGVTFDSTSCKVACTDSSRRILSRSFISGYIIIKNTFYSAGDLQSAINVNPLFISQLQSTTQYLGKIMMLG